MSWELRLAAIMRVILCRRLNSSVKVAFFFVFAFILIGTPGFLFRYYVVVNHRSTSPGEIGPAYIRTLSDVEDSDLFSFILTNGTGDVEGGRVDIAILQPFVERLKLAESIRQEERRRINQYRNNFNSRENEYNNNVNNIDNDNRNNIVPTKPSVVGRNIDDVTYSRHRKILKESDDKILNLLSSHAQHNAILSRPTSSENTINDNNVNDKLIMEINQKQKTLGKFNDALGEKDHVSPNKNTYLNGISQQNERSVVRKRMENILPDEKKNVTSGLGTSSTQSKPNVNFKETDIRMNHHSKRPINYVVKHYSTSNVKSASHADALATNTHSLNNKTIKNDHKQPVAESSPKENKLIYRKDYKGSQNGKEKVDNKDLRGDAKNISVKSEKTGDAASVKSLTNYSAEATKTRRGGNTGLTGDQPKSNVNGNQPGKDGGTVQHLTGLRTEGVLPHCNQLRNKTLVGRMAVKKQVYTLQQMESFIKGVDMGGHYRPKNCIATEKTAIIIPYRDRPQHLAMLLLNLVPVVMRQGIEFTVFVIEENQPTPFNRGMLLNVGYLEASKMGIDFDCYIFHDVDLIPLNDNNLYTCNEKTPIHFLSGVDKYNYRLAYNDLFGGVTGFTKTQFRAINGASNLYFGWGGEDDDLRKRCEAKGYTPARKAKQIGLYDMIKHEKDVNNEVNPIRKKLMKPATERQDVEGLNTMLYKVAAIEKVSLYTRIVVNINFTQVLDTAPESVADIISRMKHFFPH